MSINTLMKHNIDDYILYIYNVYHIKVYLLLRKYYNFTFFIQKIISISIILISTWIVL